MTPETELAILLTLAEVEPAAARVRALADEVDWSTLAEIAAHNRVVPMARKNLRRLGLDARIPDAVRAEWDVEEQRIAVQNLARRAWTERILAAMDEAGVEVILLKGIGFAETLYGDPTYKKMNDSDVLVRPEQVRAARDVLERLGLRCVTDLFGRSIFPEGSHHCPPYLSPDRACVVGLHWGLVSPKGPVRPDLEALWRDKVLVPYGATRAFRMSWEHNLLHLCIHLPFFKTGLRELADVYNIAVARPVDWGRVATAVEAANAFEPAYRVLALSDALVPLGAPPELLATWRARSGRFVRADVDTRLADVDRLVRSRSVILADIERQQVIFLLSRCFSERLAAWRTMWGLLLFPPPGERERLLGRAPRALDPVRAPARIWTGLALDHGHGVMMLIVVAALAALAKSGWRRARGADGERLADHPAAELLWLLE